MDILRKLTQEAATQQKQIDADKNTFPVSAFPDCVAHIIREQNRVNNIPHEFTGLSLLAAASTAIGNSYNVDINGQYQGISVIYGALVSDSSTNKSTPLKFAFAPLNKRDDLAYIKYEQAQKDFKKAEREAFKQRNENIEMPPAPIFSKTLVDDFTPEALVNIHKFNPRGICIQTAELASFFGNFNKYNKGNEETGYLKLFDGDPWTVDRKNGEPTRIKSPRVTIVGGIQPDILQDMAGGRRNSSGFMPRFIFAYPESTKKPYKNTERVSGELSRTWEGIIDALLNLPLYSDANGTPTGQEVRLTTEADQLHSKWYNLNVDLTNESDDPISRSINGKLEIYIYRFALVIQLMNSAVGQGSKDLIELPAMESAIALIEYFRNTAFKVQNYLTASPVEKLNKEKGAIYEALPTEPFTRADAIKILAAMQPNDKPETIQRRFSRLVSTPGLFEKLKNGHYRRA